MKIAAAGVTGAEQVVARWREPTALDGPAALTAELARLLVELRDAGGAKNLRGAAPLRAVGYGIPAVLEPDTYCVRRAPNIHGCRDVDLRGPDRGRAICGRSCWRASTGCLRSSVEGAAGGCTWLG